MFTRNNLPPFLMFSNEGGEAGGGSTGETPPAGDQNNSTQDTTGETPEQVIARLTVERDTAKREAESARVSARAKVAEDAKKDQLLALAKAIGIDIPGADKETVESLTAKLTAANGETEESKAKALQTLQGRAIDRAAWANKVDIERAGYLEFLLSGNEAFGKLDANAPDYQAKVTELVKGIVTTDPIFKSSAGGAQRSGAEQFDGSNGTDAVTQEAFDKMSIQDQTKLYQTNPSLFNRLSGAA